MRGRRGVGQGATWGVKKYEGGRDSGDGGRRRGETGQEGRKAGSMGEPEAYSERAWISGGGRARRLLARGKPAPLVGREGKASAIRAGGIAAFVCIGSTIGRRRAWKEVLLADGEGDNGPKRRKRVREAEGISKRNMSGMRVRECDGDGIRRGGKECFVPPGRGVDGERGGGANTGGLERQGKSNDRHVPDSDL